MCQDLTTRLRTHSQPASQFALPTSRLGYLQTMLPRAINTCNASPRTYNDPPLPLPLLHLTHRTTQLALLRSAHSRPSTLCRSSPTPLRPHCFPLLRCSVPVVPYRSHASEHADSIRFAASLVSPTVWFVSARFFLPAASALFFPSFTIALIFIVDIIEWLERASDAPALTTFALESVLWMLFSLICCYYGASRGYRAEPYATP